MARPAPSSSRHKSSTARKTSVAPAIALMVLFGAGIALILFIRSQPSAPAQTEAAAAAAEHVPFAGYHEERGPSARPAGAAQRVLTRPSRIQGSGLSADPLWIAAWDEADKAYALLDQANAARERQDHAAYQENGKLAKEAFDRALTMTAEWEEELLATRGDADPEVRGILETRGDWFDKLRVLHKTTGR